MEIERKLPERPDADKDRLYAVTLDVELRPIGKDELPISIVQALPFGTVKIRDSRSSFNVTPLSVASILTYFGESSVDLVADYNHGMYYGDNEEAAGWGESMFAIVPTDVYARVAPFIEGLDRVALVESDDPELYGVYVKVRWTEKAAQLIEAREYRYISPVVLFDYEGNASYIWNIALTNTPAIDGMDALAAAQELSPKRDTAAASVADGNVENDAVAEQISAETSDKGEAKMDNVIALAQTFEIELPEITEEQPFDIEQFAQNVTEKIDEEREAHKQALESAMNQLDAVAAQLESVNAENEQMTAQLEEVNAAAEKAEEDRRAELIANAISDGRLAESQREWAEKNFDSFEELLPTLEANRQGPPQDTVVNDDDKSDAPDFSMLEGSERVEYIRNYASEKEISFEDAFVELSAK